MESRGSSTRPLKRHKPSDNNRTTEEKTLDRISVLSDSVILHILSFLPAKFALRTSILSKRWQFLWTFVPVIDFADPLNMHGSRDLTSIVSSINKTLILHQSPKLKRFRLQFNYWEEYESDVDIWLRFATMKNVEELELDFDYNNEDDEDEYEDTNHYAVSLNVVNNSVLVRLRLVKCELEYRWRINWGSLKVLSLSKMSLSNDFMGEILRGSPSLEFLELRECWDFDSLDIKSDRMKKLVLKDYGRDSDPSSDAALKIVAPHIKSLEISGYLQARELSLTNSSLLVNVQLDFRLLVREGVNDVEHAKNVGKLLHNLRHAKDITVGNWCLKILSLWKVKFQPSEPPAWDWECLRVYTDLRKEERSGIINILSLTPWLETLVINMRITDFIPPEVHPVQESKDIKVENYWRSLPKYFTSWLYIKTVKFVDFMAQESEIQLILFLLNMTWQLQKMIIHTRSTVGLKKSLEVTRRILSTPRSSRNSVVLFS